MNLLEGKVAIVTGGAQGLGAAISENFSSHGCKVVILDLNGEKANEKANSLDGDNHLGIQCDVTNSEDRIKAIEQILEVYGKIDVLVNNAGIQYHSAIEDLDEEKWRDVFRVNIDAMMFMSRDVGKVMLKQGDGSIINIGSISSILAMPKRISYVATKTAVLGLTRTLAVEWAQRGVRANAIGPGYHTTPLFQKYVDNGAIDCEKVRKRIPAGVLGSPDDIGKAAVFFASDLSSYVTGQFLMVDGGYTVFGAPGEASE